MDSQGSPPRLNNPAYNHSARRLTPPIERQEKQTNDRQRLFSDPLTGRKGVSGDARYWDSGSEKRPLDNQPPYAQQYEKLPNEKHPYSKQQYERDRLYEKPPADAPFLDDPMARVNAKSSTYYYSKTAFERTEARNFYATRTLYVTGATLEDFISHSLKSLFSEYGTVEAVSYLYKNPESGVSFIM